MSGGGVSGEGLKKWATKMGFSGNVPVESFQKLTTPQMMPMWRHIMICVKPKEEVDNIRKNILLSKLRRDKLSGKFKGKLTVKIGQVSQIEPAKTYESLKKSVEENDAEMERETEKIQKLNEALKKMGVQKKKMQKSIEDQTVQLLAFKEKRKQFEKQLELGAFNTQLQHIFLPQKKERTPRQFVSSFTANGSLSMMDESFRPQCNSSFQLVPSDVSPQVNEVLTHLEHLDGILNSPGGIFNDVASKKSELHSYMYERIRKIPPSVLLESLTFKLQTIARELVAAATTDSADLLQMEMENNGIKSFEESLKDKWQTVLDSDEEIASLQKAVARKREELKKKKEEVVNKALKTTNAAHKEDIEKWVDSLVDICLISEKIRVLEEENVNVEYAILNLQHSHDMFNELEQDILERENDIRYLTKQVQDKIIAIKRNEGLNRVKVLKEKLFKKIEDFKNRDKERRCLFDNKDPLLSLQNSVELEVSSLVKFTAEYFQLVNGPIHITKNPPLLSNYSPYTPVHAILQDNVEKFCWNLLSTKKLQELQPSPPLSYDCEDLIESTKSEETERELLLRESIAELDQVLNMGEKNIQRATESISFWSESAAADLVPQDLLVDGLCFSSLKSKISEYLKEK